MKHLSLFTLCFGLLSLAGCTVQDSSAPPKSSVPTGTAHTGSAPTGTPLSGEIKVDGSSTVYLVSQAMAEDFEMLHPGLNVVVGTSGTGNGFKKFYQGEIDISDASRPIKPEEAEHCKTNGIEYVELTIAIDGLSVLVNPKNTFCDKLTVEQLKQIWKPDSNVKTWKDVNPEWPDEPMKLYGPGNESGTFDYFTEVIVGKAKQSRSTYTPSEDDNLLVKGIAGDQYSLGYFGYAYYAENKDKLKLLAIAPGSDASKALAPTIETIRSGEYKPLSRPLYIYVSKAALKRAEVQEFLRFYVGAGQKIVPDTGYLELDETAISESRKTLEEAIKALK